MRVQSLLRRGWNLEPVAVDVELVAGLPQIRFLGLPDQSVKESAIRIRAALKAQGFQVPSGKQILVQLNPPQEKKNLPGLDLAVALAILVETGQIPRPTKSICYFGELSLRGEVQTPEDLQWSVPQGVEQLCVGSMVPGGLSKLAFGIRQLADLREASPVDAAVSTPVPDVSPPRPAWKSYCYSPRFAELIGLAATGEHPILLAGPQGVGKSTFASSLHRVMDDPDPGLAREAQRIARLCGVPAAWRPLRHPHHSASSLGMIGGGQPPLPGEFTRAHGGILLMDEFLEFRRDVQEALREPLETGTLVLSRSSHSIQYPARFMLVATTNLCQCGRWNPSDSKWNCRCPGTKRRAYLERLRGPTLDRFQVVLLLKREKSQSERVGEPQIRERVQQASEFRFSRKQIVPNSQLSLDQLESSVTPAQNSFLEDFELSSREKLQALRVARSWADLQLRKSIRDEDLIKAMEFSPRRLESYLNEA